jgi:chaperone modulatory protein CbpM
MSSVAEHLGPGEHLLERDEFARIAGLQESQLRELLDYQLLSPTQLDTRMAFALREANRIGRDFDLDLFSIGLLAGYVLRIDNLEAEVQRLRAHRPVQTVHTEVSFTSVTVRQGP